MTATSLVGSSFMRTVVFAGLLLCTLAPAPAGQTLDATIFGQVSDQSGAVLPGVTVTVSGPSLQIKQLVVVTDAAGEYRVTPLPLGTYTVEFTLSGFQTHRHEGVRLTAGFVAKLDAQLQVGAVEETVTVSGQSPVVDVKTTSAGTQITKEILESIPSNRNSYNSLLTLAAGARPGVDSGTSLSIEVVLKAFGRTGDGWISVDGLPINAASDNNFQTSTNYAAMEEAAVQTIGTDAEAPTSGIQINVISKSGSNQFHGDLFGSQTGDWLQSKDNLDATLRAQSLTSSRAYSKRWDASGDLGGRIVQDKLWFYGGGRRRRENFGVLGAFNADGTPAELQHDQRYLNGKVTYQISSSQQVVGSLQWRTHDQNNGPSSLLAAPDSLRKQHFFTLPFQSTWQLIKGNKTVSVQAGDMRARIPVPPILTDHAAWKDDGNGLFGGVESRVGRHVEEDRFSFKGTVNWYKSGWSGNHDFKTGALYTVINQDTGLIDNGLPVGNYTLRYANSTFDSPGTATEVRAGNNPIDPKGYLGYLGLFFQDSWSPNRRLTLNLGVRYANDRAWLPPQCRVDASREFAIVFPAQCFSRSDLKSWNPLAPRLHAAYDLTGNGKTVVKGGWGRFYRMHEQAELDVANPNSRKEARFKWKDLNNNRYFDAGEANLDPNGPDFSGITDFNASYTAAESPNGTVSTLGFISNPDLKEQGSDEFALSVERELMGNFAMRVTGLYVKEFNTQRIVNPLRPYSAFNIAVTNPDAGPDNIPGNADDPGTVITYYDYPASLKGAAFEQAMFINDAASDANYTSFEMALNKRFSKRWQMLSSYSATKKHIPIPRNSAFNPNSDIFPTSYTWEWQFRTSGSYQFPGDIQVSSNLLVQSGLTWARTVQVKGGKQITSIILYTEPIGAEQTPAQTLVALSIQKSFRLRQRGRIAVGLQLNNLLNANFSPDLPQTRAGAQFGYALNAVSPRVGDITLRYTF